MRTPPSLLSLTIDSALLNISSISDLSPLPDHIICDLFLKTLSAGKLNEKVLKLFIATGKDEILSLIEAHNIQQIHSPVLPTISFKMSCTTISDSEVDIVIAAINPDLKSFMNEWRPFFSQFHLIIVKDPDMKEELQIPEGFNADVFTKADITRWWVRPPHYLLWLLVQHIANLKTPATPFFFNTLYDPYRKGADFVRGYPFSLRSGVTCGLSCGLWLNLADLDAPTQALKPGQRNSRYVDAVMTVPVRALLPISGINIAFDRELVGPALFPALRLAGEGKFRWETVEDIWCGMCVKSGRGVKLMEEVVPFFQSVRLPRSAVTAEDCVVEMAKTVKEELGKVDPMFSRASDAMAEWVKLWKSVGTGSSGA
ncbi:hypothetical protein M0R45_027885 [Rubus argutus]|uniref:Uncharacterized protein n=1 Tax=Rubus argutus TaxID=59490 RepID=A0AAW1W5I2_RUBAR